MKRLKLNGMASTYEATLTLPVNQHPSSHEMIAMLVDAEVQYRAQRKMERFLHTSKMRFRSTLADVQCSAERNLQPRYPGFTGRRSLHRPRRKYPHHWCHRSAANHSSACALGHQACASGYRTLYFNLNRLSEQITIAKADGTLIKWLNQLKKVQLIILDDFGIQSIAQSVKLILLQILEDRYEEGATMICSQLPVAKWYEYLEEPTLADAILDRIIPRAHRIELKGKSRRKNLNQLP
jgi:hypothetical protein